jgi:chaperone BCS1
MLWLSRQPEWQRSREFETTTRATTPGLSSTRIADNSFGDDEEEEDEEVPGKVKTRVVFQPTFDSTHTIYYKGHWLRVRRGRKQDGSNCELLSIRFVTLNPYFPSVPPHGPSFHFSNSQPIIIIIIILFSLL